MSLRRRGDRRPLKGARIETSELQGHLLDADVASSQGRGSKHDAFAQLVTRGASPPHRGEDRKPRRPERHGGAHLHGSPPHRGADRNWPFDHCPSVTVIRVRSRASKGRLLTGARIETRRPLVSSASSESHLTGCGSKRLAVPDTEKVSVVASSQERGSKLDGAVRRDNGHRSPPHRGADRNAARSMAMAVTPCSAEAAARSKERAVSCHQWRSRPLHLASTLRKPVHAHRGRGSAIGLINRRASSHGAVPPRWRRPRSVERVGGKLLLDGSRLSPKRWTTRTSGMLPAVQRLLGAKELESHVDTPTSLAGVCASRAVGYGPRRRDPSYRRFSAT